MEPRSLRSGAQLCASRRSGLGAGSVEDRREREFARRHLHARLPAQRFQQHAPRLHRGATPARTARHRPPSTRECPNANTLRASCRGRGDTLNQTAPRRRAAAAGVLPTSRHAGARDPAPLGRRAGAHASCMARHPGQPPRRFRSYHNTPQVRWSNASQCAGGRMPPAASRAARHRALRNGCRVEALPPRPVSHR